MTTFVLDTSAILTVLNQEEVKEELVSLLDTAKQQQAMIFLPFMALMELEYLLLRKISPEETDYLLTLVRAWPIQVSESSEEWRHKAAQVKARTPLSVAGAWIASLALLREAELVHKDPEYDQVPNLLMLKLPYKA